MGLVPGVAALLAKKAFVLLEAAAAQAQIRFEEGSWFFLVAVGQGVLIRLTRQDYRRSASCDRACLLVVPAYGNYSPLPALVFGVAGVARYGLSRRIMLFGVFLLKLAAAPGSNSCKPKFAEHNPRQRYLLD